MQTPYFRTYSRRALFDLPKLCMVVQLVVPIRKGVNHFIDPVYSFPASGQNADFWPLGKFKYRLTPLRGVLPVNEWMNEIGKTHGNTVQLPLFAAFRYMSYLQFIVQILCSGKNRSNPDSLGKNSSKHKARCLQVVLTLLHCYLKRKFQHYDGVKGRSNVANNRSSQRQRNKIKIMTEVSKYKNDLIYCKQSGQQYILSLKFWLIIIYHYHSLGGTAVVDVFNQAWYFCVAT